MKHLLLLCCVLLCVNACSPISNALHQPARDAVTAEGYLTTSGANALFPSEPFEKIDLLKLLDPESRWCGGNCPPQVRNPDPLAKPLVIHDADLEAAFAAFYTYDGGQAKRLQLRRNRVQDRVLAASEQRCSVYKLFLQRVQSEDKSMFGSLTTILAGAGAIATGQLNSRVFAGLAGIVSGVGAETEQAYFGNLAARVIVPAIDVKRKTMLDAIGEHRKEPIGIYSAQRALMDAAQYHGACTVTSGLIQATESLNPGLTTMNRTLALFRTTRTLLDPNAPPAEVKAALAAANAGNAGTTATTGAVVTGDEASLPSEIYRANIERIGAAFASLQGAIGARSDVVDQTKGATDAEKATQKTKLAAIAAASITSYNTIVTNLSQQCLTTTLTHEKSQLLLDNALKAATAADRARKRQALIEAQIKFDIEAGAILEKRGDLITEQLKALETDIAAGVYSEPATITAIGAQVLPTAC